jgi:hypothetical protein
MTSDRGGVKVRCGTKSTVDVPFFGRFVYRYQEMDKRSEEGEREIETKRKIESSKRTRKKLGAIAPEASVHKSNTSGALK